ncbi:MAG: ATP-binding protein [Treponema sp.]|nr:ATP-binding protein [Treponema sp.]
MGSIRPFSGIKAKTTLYMIIPVIITFIIISSVLFISLFNSQQKNAISEFQNITSRFSADFERKINNALDYLSSVTSVLEFQVYEGSADREALQRIIYYIFDGHTVDSSSIYFEPDMYDNKDSEYINTVYGTALSGRISYYFYRFNERTGYRQAAMDDEIEFTLPLYTDTKVLNAPTYTEPGIYNIDGIDMLKFVIAYPIFGRNGEFIGVITADIFLGDMHEELRAEEVYDTGYIIIGNDKNQIIYSPRFEDIGKTRTEAGILYPIPPIEITSEVFNSTSILNNKKTLVSRQTVYFPQFDSRFYISVAAPVGEINAQGRRLLFTVIMFSAGLLIIIALFLYYLIGKITKPVIEFSQSTAKIAQGDYSVRITGEYQDEFSVLKNSMNLMTERIENAFKILQNILNGIDAFVYVTDTKTGEILFINEQMKKEFSVKDDAIGQYCYKIFRKDQDSICEFCPCYKLDIDSNTPIVWEDYNLLTNRYYHNTDCYIEWIGGTKAHLQHSVDITELKTVTEEKLKAEETSRMKSSFLANMSHEIRTPMNAILGVTELLIQNEKLPAEVEEGLEKIYSSCDLLLGIINDILDFSKIEAGKLDIVPVTYRVASLINDSVHLNMMRIDSKPIEFELDVNENIPETLIGDELRIKQILNNILSNAIKYTDHGKVTLSIGFEHCDETEKSTMLVLSVQDTGHGMTDEQLGKMFEEYSRFNAESNISVEGTGLGLAITQRLINLMNGSMHVQSEVKKGSLFVIKIPQKKIDDQIMGKEIAENLKHFRMNYMTQRKISQIVRDPMPYGSVLVVDDVETNIYVAVGLLKLYRLKIDTAMNGYEAIEKVKQGNKYDVIFMDHMMPEIDGIETTKIIRVWESEQCNNRDLPKQIPIVALTANAVFGQSDMFLQNGFDDFISKPIDIRQLNGILNRLIRDKYPSEVVEAAKLKYKGKISGETNSKSDSLLIESFLRDGKKAFDWLKEKIDLNDEDTLYKFTVSIHGIKSSLWNIGEMQLAESAVKLEKWAREKNIESIKENESEFKEKLGILLDNLELKQKENSSIYITDEENITELKENLNELIKMTEDYNRKGLLEKISSIKQGTKETKEILDKITSYITHSNFDEALSVLNDYLKLISFDSVGSP